MEDNQNFNKISEKVNQLGLLSKRFLKIDMNDKCKKIIEKAKLKQRTDMKLEEWEKLQYVDDNWCEEVLNKLYDRNDIDIEEYDNLSNEEFIQKYEKLNKPVIIRGITKYWLADSNWTFQKIYEKYKNAKVKVGEDDEEYKIKIKLKYFFEYLIFNKDDSPLYMFESSIENHKNLNRLTYEYEVPKYFKEDLFKYIGEDRRPPYRWFLIGPQRSGTAIHIDPIGTSAWNTSLQGHKLWLLIPPGLSKSIVKGKELLKKGEDDEALMYMRYLFPRIIEKYGDLIKPLWFVQKPKETVFIPGGWWHAVVNLDDTIAITQNYCNSVNFESVWLRVREERKRMAVKFLNKLEKYKPNLYMKAIELNKRDDFIIEDKKFIKRKRGSERRSTSSSSSSSNSSSSSSSYSSSSSSTYSD